MKLTRYLVVDSWGRARAMVHKPPLKPGEYAFLLKIVIPDNPRTFGPVDLVVPEDEPPSMEDVAYEGEGPPIGSFTGAQWADGYPLENDGQGGRTDGDE